MVRKVLDRKSNLQVQSRSLVFVPIDRPHRFFQSSIVKMSLPCTDSELLSVIPPPPKKKLKDRLSLDSEHIPCVGNLSRTRQYPHTNFEMPCFVHTENVTGSKNLITGHAPLRLIYRHFARTCYGQLIYHI